MKSYLKKTLEWHEQLHEDLIRQRKKLETQTEELQGKIGQLQEEIDELVEGCSFHKAEIKRIKENPVYSGESSKNTNFSTRENEEFYDIPPPGGLDPREMMRDAYRGLRMEQAIRRALAALGGIAKIAEITEEIYDTDCPEDFKRCRQSLGASLRVGTGKRGWEKQVYGRYRLLPDSDPP